MDEGKEGEDGRDPTPKNMGALTPAVKSRCFLTITSKMIAHKTQMTTLLR
jgi:hypothetical protein